MFLWAFQLHSLSWLSTHRYVENQINKDIWITHSSGFSKELKRSNSGRQLNNIYSFAVKRNSFSSKDIMREAFIQMEAYRLLSPSVTESVTKRFHSSKGCCSVEAGCIIGSDRAVTTQCSCLLALEEGCPCGAPFCHQGERGSEVPLVH